MKKQLFKIGKLNVTPLKIIILVVLLVVISVGAVFSVNAYNNYVREQNIKTAIEQIDKQYNEFINGDRAKKVEILGNFVKNQKAYAKSTEETYTEVKGYYAVTIKKMAKVFTQNYADKIDKAQLTEEEIKAIDKNVKDNKFDDVKMLNSKIATLKEIKTLVSDEKSVVYADDSSSLKELETLLDDAIKNCETKVEEINKAKKTYEQKLKEEAERKAKEEAERKAQAEQQAQQSNSSNNSFDNGGSSYSGGSSNETYSSSNNDGNQPYSKSYCDGWDENGNYIGRTYGYSDGTIRDENGKILTSREEMEEFGMKILYY